MVYQYKIHTGLWGIPQITVFKYAPILDLVLTANINIKNEQVQSTSMLYQLLYTLT